MLAEDILVLGEGALLQKMFARTQHLLLIDAHRVRMGKSNEELSIELQPQMYFETNSTIYNRG